MIRPFPQYDYVADDCSPGEPRSYRTTQWWFRWSVVSVMVHRQRASSYTWGKILTDADSLIPFGYTGNNQREQAQYSKT